ncbi:hypothetical protein BJP36_26495 [Moorena producens JHB]|uniref:Uncharacterized protein n=1 Tax=Moorena producens (strain JHB) TaxID=1454205 RepID=A0A1D9G5Y1_MOOP1|nr:hypothetical protein [Moorena producens]AOY82934.1 hypothetical protein BJP36_26495 [Moorena producens JHB]
MLLALVIAIALTWMPSFTVASAQPIEYIPGLQFSIEPWGEFVESQSGAIYSPGHKVRVFYDSLRASSNNGSCPSFSPSTEVTGYVMSDNSGKITKFPLESLDPPAVDFVKVGHFTTPKCYQGSGVIEIWFTGTGSGCVDSDFAQNYTFPVICE